MKKFAFYPARKCASKLFRNASRSLQIFRYFDLDGGCDLDMYELSDNPLIAMMVSREEEAEAAMRRRCALAFGAAMRAATDNLLAVLEYLSTYCRLRRRFSSESVFPRPKSTDGVYATLSDTLRLPGPRRRRRSRRWSRTRSCRRSSPGGWTSRPARARGAACSGWAAWFRAPGTVLRWICRV